MFTRVFPQRILGRGITPSESHLEYFRAPRRRSIRGSAKSIARSREDPFHSIATLVDVRSPSLRQLFTEVTRVPPDPLLSFLSLFLARCARTLLQLPGDSLVAARREIKHLPTSLLATHSRQRSGFSFRGSRDRPFILVHAPRPSATSRSRLRARRSRLVPVVARRPRDRNGLRAADIAAVTTISHCRRKPPLF